MDVGELGQVATPAPLARAVCRWTIRERDGPPLVLDPAAGGGMFLAAAADRLASIGLTRPLDHIVAVDVDATALAAGHATVADRNGSLRTERRSFLSCSPADLGRFDAVVGNPPYLRQEAIDTDHYRAHLDELGPADERPYREGSRAISRRSDASVYFLTQATRFLEPHGRLGLVVPAKWLDTRYGESLQLFIHDHYRLEAVVGFDVRAFSDALVDAILVLAERQSSATDRRAGPTRFVRVRERIAPTTLHRAVTGTVSPSDGGVAVDQRDGHRVVGIDQATLAGTDGGKLSPYLTAPVEFLELLEHPDLVPLGTLGRVHRGVMTGANDFFLVDADGDATGAEDRFLRPAIRSIRDVDGPVVRTPPERYLFDVHGFVASVLEEAPGRPPEEAVRAAMARKGYDGALAHIRRGEERGYDERRTCASRSVWFDLGPLTAPEVLHPKFFDERVVVVHNPDGLVPTNAVDCVAPVEDVPGLALVGTLNSTVYAALLECWGRAEGGGALQVMTYEVERVPVPDPRGLPSTARDSLVAATRDLLAGRDGARTEIDRILIHALDLPFGVARLRELRRRAVTRRRDGAEPAVLVGEDQ